MLAQRVTKELVWKAADELFAKGIVVTQEKVRKEIGYGSYTTIGKYLKEWKEREDNDVSSKNYPIPDSVNKALEEIKQQFWNAFCQKYELITDNEQKTELEKENELLREQLASAKKDSIALDELRRTRDEERKERQDLIGQLRMQAAKIQELEDNFQEAIR